LQKNISCYTYNITSHCNNRLLSTRSQKQICMKKNLTKGFTLIELLVVIAIIGILASVILASLNSARAKGTDAAVKSDLENARPQAEIYYDGSSSSYASVCTTATSAAVGGINTMLVDAASKATPGNALVTTFATAGTATTVVCHDSAAGWAAAAPLKSVANNYWCVDSTGKAEQTPTVLGASVVVCP
jgi:type IV pilus assembly protein PilA